MLSCYNELSKHVNFGFGDSALDQAGYSQQEPQLSAK